MKMFLLLTVCLRDIFRTKSRKYEMNYINAGNVNFIYPG